MALGLALAAAPVIPCVLPLVMPAPAHAQVGVAEPGRQQFLFAYRLFERGEDRLAAEAFDQFLMNFPNDPRRGDAAFYRATLLRRSGESAAAWTLLEAAPAPSILPASAFALLRGQVLIDLNRHADALKVLEGVKLDGLDTESRASAVYLRGMACRGAGNLDAAIVAFREAAGIETTLKPRATLDLANALSQAGRGDDAIAALTAGLAIKDNPLAAETALHAGALSYLSGKYDKAAEFYGMVVTRHAASPQFGDAVVGVMLSHYAAARYEAVIQTGTQHLKALDAHHAFTARYLVGSAQQDLGRHDAAITTFIDALSHAQSVPTVEGRDRATYKLAASLHETGRYAEMDQALLNFATRFPDSPLAVDVEFLHASAQAKRGDAAGAAARFTEIIARGEADPYYSRALLGRAKLYEGTQQPGAALKDYQAYLAFAAGKPGVEPTQRTQEATLRVIALLTTQGSAADAVKLTNSMLAAGKLDPLTEQEAMFRMVVALSRAGQREAALKAVDELFAKHPQNRFASQGRYYRGMLLMAMGRPTEAVADLRSAGAAADLPTAARIEALRLAAVQLRDAKDGDNAQVVLTQLEALGGAKALKPDERIWLARRALDKGDARAAMQTVEPVIKAQGVEGPRRAEALLVTGMAQCAMNQPDQAIATFERIVAEGRGFELRAQLEAARTLAGTGKAQDALLAYGGLVSVEPSEIASAAIFESAMLHRRIAEEKQQAGDPVTARKQMETARGLLLRLVLLYPFKELSPLPELGYIELAEVEQSLQLTKDATDHLRELGEKFPDGPYAGYGKAMLARAAGRVGDAEFILKKLRETPTDARLTAKVERSLRELGGRP